MQINTWLMCKESVYRVLSHRQDISITTSAPRLRDHKKKATESTGARGWEGPEWYSVFCTEQYKCSYKRTTYLRRIKQAGILAWNRKEVISLPLAEHLRYWRLMAAGEGGLVFFKAVAPGRLTKLYCMAHTWCVWQALTGLLWII